MLKNIIDNKSLLIGLGISIAGFVYEAVRANKLQDELIDSKNECEVVKLALAEANYSIRKMNKNIDI